METEPIGVDDVPGLTYCQFMVETPNTAPNEEYVGNCLVEVRNLMGQCLAQTPLAGIAEDQKGLLGNGKMLRSRLAFRLGPAAKVPYKTLLHSAAAVELIHAASLLHDDVIDGGYLRRGAPAFWVQHGISGAILLGDLLLVKSLSLVLEVEDGRLVPALVRLTGSVCEAETEQELVLRGRTLEWDQCVDVARRKTGSLFAFLGYICGGQDKELQNALEEAGSAIGTAYQLSDDILDATGSSEASGKTLGSDYARSKFTVATHLSHNGMAPAHVESLCRKSRDLLAPWPEIQKAWDVYLIQDLRPALERNLPPVVR